MPFYFSFMAHTKSPASPSGLFFFALKARGKISPYKTISRPSKRRLRRFYEGDFLPEIKKIPIFLTKTGIFLFIGQFILFCQVPDFLQVQVLPEHLLPIFLVKLNPVFLLLLYIKRPAVSVLLQ